MDLRSLTAKRSSAIGASHLSQLKGAGYCIVPRLLEPEDISEINRDLDSRFARTPFCKGEFYGETTKRFGSLLKRSRLAQKLVLQPAVLDLVRAVLSPYCDSILLNLTQAIEIHPGAPQQFPHRDQDMWGGPKGSLEYLINVMWPLCPFTPENGATVLWPDSHRQQDQMILPEDQALPAVMNPGSALLFLGSTLHAGGANRSALARRGIIVSYCLGWLRPFEAQMLIYPPEVARGFPPELTALLGYSIHRPNLGNFEGQSPAVLLQGRQTEEFLPAIDALLPEHDRILAELRDRRLRAAA
ncbi:MAG: phytanoyl-CoA dioxygenase family protein [Alphaproteobacteria bacterium]|nr:phytanoyl-CoA dioxygenase family protein [Alphaproteobacteria bacterium]MBV9064099.1 phytanoyl-CoA dioxygenase family protein [Alphaproteobacteria bacterium]